MAKGTFLLSLFGGVIGDAEELFLVQALEQLRLKNPTGYEATVKSLHIGLVELKKVTDGTPNKFDDIFVNNALEGIEASALANNVELPD